MEAFEFEPSADAPAAQAEPQVQKVLTFKEFAKRIKGTEHEVWTKLLEIRHGRFGKTLAGWYQTLEGLKKE